MNLLNPFDEVFNHTYFQICKKIQTFYGVNDADVYFTRLRKSVLDAHSKDVHNLKNFTNLYNYCEHVQILRKYGLDHKK
jgi:hypothetical protein